MRDQTINSSPNVSISSPQVEPLIVGNANGIIRFLGTLSILLVGLAFWAGMEIGHLKNRVQFLEDIVINQTYVMENSDAIRK
jgi:hypothetical protein